MQGPFLYLDAKFIFVARFLRPAKVHLPKIIRDVPLPEELIDALDTDPELAAVFHALT